MTGETAFQDTVVEMARLYNWDRIAHFRPLRRKDGSYETPCQYDAKGFVDLFMLRTSTRQRLAVELKTGTNTPDEDQQRWLYSMELCGIPAFIWKPCDWKEIEYILKHGAE